MTSLKKTASRLELLQAVADGKVWRGTKGAFDFIRLAGGSYVRVSGRMRELARHGLVDLPRIGSGYAEQWVLTDAGSALLAEWLDGAK